MMVPQCSGLYFLLGFLIGGGAGTGAALSVLCLRFHTGLSNEKRSQKAPRFHFLDQSNASGFIGNPGLFFFNWNSQDSEALTQRT
jgi:hypothetical protein